jgi:hypothetical protein
VLALELSVDVVKVRHPVTRAVDEQLVAAGKALVHRHQQPALSIKQRKLMRL